MRAVAKEKHAKLAVELNQFLESLEEIKEDMKNQKEGLKIKFRNRRERKNFYSGKIEEIFAKYEEMKEEFEEVIPDYYPLPLFDILTPANFIRKYKSLSWKGKTRQSLKTNWKNILN